MRKLLIAGVLAGVIVSALPALAGTQDPVVKQRERRQQQRIRQGMRSGRLTPQQARRLERGQARIHRTERRMKSKGYLTAKNRRRLAKMQNRQSRAIYQAKHKKPRG